MAPTAPTHPVVGFGIPIHESVEGHAFMGLSLTWAAWTDIAPANWRLKVAQSRGCSIVENRNRIATELLRDGFAIDGRDIPGQDAPRSPLTTRAADVIVWNDSDCVVEPDEYVRLVESLLAAPDDVAAIGYAFPMQSGKDRPRPNVGRDAGPPIRFSAPGPVDLAEVDWLGFGVIATRAEAYRKLSRDAGRDANEGPWFSHSCGKDGRGEDIGWCRDVRAAGFILAVDVGVLGAHCYRAPHRLDDFYSRHHQEG